MIPTSTKWHTGQRVARDKPRAFGTVVGVDGRMKVQWDNGAVSYYKLTESRNLQRLDEPSQNEG